MHYLKAIQLLKYYKAMNLENYSVKFRSMLYDTVNQNQHRQNNSLIQVESKVLNSNNILFSKESKTLAQVNTSKILMYNEHNTKLNNHSTNMSKNIDRSGHYNSSEIVSNIKTLSQLENSVREFDGCELKRGALNTVFGDGNPNAKIMAIGEAPGAQEDKMGIPFCGESGKLLNKMFESIGLYRDKNLYITNTVFWRPPNNRRPTEDELEICRPFVAKHISIIQPKIIIMVGATAISALLNEKLNITQARRNYYSYSNQYLNHKIQTTPIFHPAYLLRQPNKKKEAWEDLLLIKEYLESNDLL